MNKIKLLGLALITAASSLVSCSDYLEVKLDDQLSLEEVFSKRTTTLQYLKHIYSFMPYEAQFQMENKVTDYRDADGAAVAMSDEAHFSWTMWVPHLNFVTGDYGPTTANWNNWPLMYQGIEQCGIFMENVGSCPEFTAAEKKVAVAEARFIRAYCYFQLMRRFGPCFLWGDRRSEQTIRPQDIDRDPLEDVLDFMISEIDKSIADLPSTIENGVQMDGRMTKGAAMAAKSRILLYAASPLFNGCDLYKGMTNKDGKFLFPQTPDPNKWTKAAEAAKAVIDLNQYKLYEDNNETDPFQKAIKSYQGVQFEPWNSEIIWGYWPRLCPYSESAGVGWIGYMHYARYAPKNIIAQGCSGYCPSMKLVDTYPMAESGRYPITGYENNGVKPIVDPKSGYQAEGFTNDWEHPIEGAKFGGVKAHNSCVGRDARFYASVMANGFYWVNEFTKDNKKTVVTFFNGGTSPFTNLGADGCKVGFLWRRFLPMDRDYQNNQWGEFFWFYFRLAEIYLNYAEACNEKPNREPAESLKYINMIRNRAGLNNLEEAYPEINFMSDQAALREMIRKERMVELAFEGHRYYDCRRWMIAETEMNQLQPTLNLASTTYEGSWERTNTLWNRAMKFEKKNYFMPINQEQLNEMVNITQNYGW